MEGQQSCKDFMCYQLPYAQLFYAHTNVSGVETTASDLSIGGSVIVTSNLLKAQLAYSLVVIVPAPAIDPTPLGDP
jgi:hypothetical protein